MDIATLGIAIESGDAVTASNTLDQLEKSARGAQGATTALSEAARDAAGSERTQTAATQASTQATRAHTAVAQANTVALQGQARAARQVAFRQQQMVFQLNDIGQGLLTGMPLHTVAIQQGSQLAQVYGGPGGLNLALRDTAQILGSVAKRLAPVAAIAAAVGVGVAGLAQAIEDSTGEAVTMGDVMIGTFNAVSSGIADVVGPAFAELAPHITTVWETVKNVTAGVINVMVRGLVSRFEIMKGTLRAGATAVGVLINNVIVSFAEPIQNLLNIIADRVNDIVRGVNAISGLNLDTIEITLPGDLQKRDFEGELTAIAAETAQSVNEILQRDYAGEAFSFIADASVARMRTRLAKAGEEAAKAAADALVKAESAFQDVINRAETDRLQSQGQTEELINRRLQSEINAINQAAEATIKAGADAARVRVDQAIAIQDATIAAENAIFEHRESLRKEEADRAAREAQERLQAEQFVRDLERQNLNAQYELFLVDEQTFLQRETELRLAELEARLTAERALYQGNQEALTEIERAGQLARAQIERDLIEQTVRYEQDRQNARIEAAGGFFGQLGAITEGFAGQQSKAAQALFAVEKGFQIAQALLAAPAAAAKAMATVPFPGNFAAAASVYASIIGQVAQLRSINFSGRSASGGGSPPSRGGGNFNSAATNNPNFTAAVQGTGTNNQSANVNTAITIIDQTPSRNETVEQRGPNGERQLVIREAKDSAMRDMMDDIARGGPFRDQLEQTFNLVPSGGV